MTMIKADLATAPSMVEAALRRAETLLAVKSGYACPTLGCGLRYRHQHDGVWWPPEGQPWPPGGRDDLRE